MSEFNPHEYWETRLGELLYPLELALVSLLREGPSIEMMICEKPGPATDATGPESESVGAKHGA